MLEVSYQQAGSVGAVEPVIVSGRSQTSSDPTAVISATGVPWAFFGRSGAGRVQVWATAYVAAEETGDQTWTTPEVVSTSEHPSFNQEVAAHADGSIELCWQGRDAERLGIYTRTHAGGSWGPTAMVSAGVEGNVRDPSVAVYADGGAAYAWSEYAAGPRTITSVRDYALHASVAVTGASSTGDQQLWCAFDLLTVSGHGGSGPTKLRPSAEVGADPTVVEGMRQPGANVPPELLPEVSASIRVVPVADDGVYAPPGDLAPALDGVPSGLPKLVATDDGGLAVAYRVHRKLPLMTYYWEVATQVLGEEGWLPPTTFSGTDGTLEEVSIAPVGARRRDRRSDRRPGAGRPGLGPRASAGGSAPTCWSTKAR